MKAIICDQCKKIGVQSAYDSPPMGWYTLRKVAEVPERHFCGDDCLLQYWVDAQAAREAARNV
jgi:hypothetical protein